MVIGKRIRRGYLAVAILVLAVGGIGFHSVSLLGGLLDQALTRTVSVHAALLDLRFWSTKTLADLQNPGPMDDPGSLRTRQATHGALIEADLGAVAEATSRYLSLVLLHFEDEIPAAREIAGLAARHERGVRAYYNDQQQGRPVPPGAAADLHAINERLLARIAVAGRRESDEITQYQADAEQTVRAKGLVVIGASLLAFALALLAGRFIARSLSSPIGALRAATLRFGTGDMTTRVAIPSAHDEIRDLALGFNAMASRLSESMLSRDFVNGIVDSMTEALVVTDAAGRILHHNKALLQLAGIDAAADVRGRVLTSILFTPQQMARILQHVDTGTRIELQLADSPPTDRHVSVSAVSLEGGSGAGTILHILDISQRKSSEERMYRLANFDALTGLPNRNLALELLRQSLSRLAWNNVVAGVLFCDLDRFKLVNDTLGHAAGDVVLAQVADRLEACLRPGDVVARLAGDEFLILLNEVNNIGDISMVAGRIIEALGRPLAIDALEVFVSASIGVSVAPHDGLDPEILLRHADMAMYAAKAEGANRFRYFDDDMRVQSEKRMEMEKALRMALQSSVGLLAYFQPQATMDGRLVGFEALVRWLHPDLGLLAPATFLPMAVDAGLMAAIDEVVLRAACCDLQRWREAGHSHLRVAVNMSNQTFRRTDLIELIASVLDECNLPPHALDLELTEGIIMDDIEQSVSTMGAIEALGVTLSIDDFGTGFSSLAQLKRCPIGTLKIDRCFITNLTCDDSDAVITETIIALAHKLKLNVLAEGVETRQQLLQLAGYGCDQIQGYLLSPPVAADRVPALIAELDSRFAHTRSDRTQPPGPGKSVDISV